MEKFLDTRPYLTLTNAEIKKDSQGKFTLILTTKNNTSALVKDVDSRLLVLEESLNQNKEPSHKFRFKSAHDTGPGGVINRELDVNVTTSTLPAFIVYQIKYTNPSKEEPYFQEFFLKFRGVRPDSTFKTQLSDAGLDAKIKIEQYMEERPIPPL